MHKTSQQDTIRNSKFLKLPAQSQLKGAKAGSSTHIKEAAALLRESDCVMHHATTPSTSRTLV